MNTKQFQQKWVKDQYFQPNMVKNTKNNPLHSKIVQLLNLLRLLIIGMLNLALRNFKIFGVASGKKGQKLGGANGPTGIPAQWGEILSEGEF